MSLMHPERKPERRKPLIPDGNEVYVAALIAIIIGLAMYYDGIDWRFYIPAVIVSLLGFSYGIQLWLEDDRQYWKGWSLYQEINSILGGTQADLVKIQNVQARKNAADGIKDRHEVSRRVWRVPETPPMPHACRIPGIESHAGGRLGQSCALAHIMPFFPRIGFVHGSKPKGRASVTMD